MKLNGRAGDQEMVITHLLCRSHRSEKTTRDHRQSVVGGVCPFAPS